MTVAPWSFTRLSCVSANSSYPYELFSYDKWSKLYYGQKQKEIINNIINLSSLTYLMQTLKKKKNSCSLI